MYLSRIQEFVDASNAVPSVVCENDHQREVFTNAYYAACDLIGGLENILQDYPDDDPEYINARKCLLDHSGLVADIFWEATHNEYGCGYAGTGNTSQKHYRFAGKVWTMNAVEQIVQAMGR